MVEQNSAATVNSPQGPTGSPATPVAKGHSLQLEREAKAAEPEDSKSAWYWVQLLLLTAIGLGVGRWMGETGAMRDLRYWVYQKQTTALRPDSPFAIEPVFVTITDDEFWKGPPAHRVPLKRSYLADLVKVAASMHPRTIALDFDFRDPTPDGKVTYPDYEAESKDLVDVIDRAAQEVPVVLPRTIRAMTDEETSSLGSTPRAPSSQNGSDAPEYVAESDIFSRHNISAARSIPATAGAADDHPARIYEGYIQFAYDLRQIPPRLPMMDRPPLDSFSIAILHASEPSLYDVLIGKTGGHNINLKFGNFVQESEFTTRIIPAFSLWQAAEAGRLRETASHSKQADQRKALLDQAQQLDRKARPQLERMRSRVVIICGMWHQDAYNEGFWVDRHSTPVGRIAGAFVHANYAEALRIGRYYQPVPEWVVIMIEVGIIFGAALVLTSRKIKPLKKYAVTALLLVGPAFAGYVFIQNLGVFFEFLLPLIVIIGHLAGDKILEWRRLAGEYEELKKSLEQPLPRPETGQAA
jgi:CHASE2 domain-containing sensor protein